MTKPTVEQVTDFLRAHISRRTKIPADQLLGSAVLLDLGLESIDAVLISGEIEDEFQIEVEPSLMFEFQTLDEVAAAVVSLFDQP